MAALLTLLIRARVPESQHWLFRRRRYEEARESLAWALRMDPKAIQLPMTKVFAEPMQSSKLFQHPRHYGAAR